ncbi:MAG TPA: TlpA disulfide reductase family protein [Methylomirabilota bacterium]|jgi:peroxiredoxin
MSRSLAFTIASVLLALVTGALDEFVTPASPAPARVDPRTGRRLSLDAAMRDLDLIRPGRPKAAQDFTVPLLQGSSFRLADHRGKVVLINFWATWCPPCLEEMPALERLWHQQRDRGFVLIAVSLDADRGVVKPFVAEHRLTFPIGLDAKLEVANLYGIRALPATFVVDRQGQVAALALGPRAWDNDAAHSLVEELSK